MRRAGVAAALVAAALVASAEVTATLVTPATLLVAIAAEFFRTAAAALVVAVVAALAFKTLAWRAAVVGARIGARLDGRRALGAGGRCDLGRRAPRVAGIAMGLAAPVLVTLGFCPVDGGGALTGGGYGLRALLRTVVAALMPGTVAIMARPAFFGTAAGTPDFDQFGHSRRFRCGLGCRRRIRRRG